MIEKIEKIGQHWISGATALHDEVVVVVGEHAGGAGQPHERDGDFRRLAFLDRGVDDLRRGKAHARRGAETHRLQAEPFLASETRSAGAPRRPHDLAHGLEELGFAGRSRGAGD